MGTSCTQSCDSIRRSIVPAVRVGWAAIACFIYSALENLMSSEKRVAALYDSRRTLPLEPFEEHYDPLSSVIYGLRDPQPKKRDFGSKNNQKCALCDKSESETTFRIEAHLIPESLGNRHYVSNEECDACNIKYGSLYEPELAKMLLAERAIQRVRAKGRGTARLKSNSGNSYVGGGSFDMPLQIFYDRQDPFLHFEYVNDSAKLSVNAPSFRPIHALKSILKSFWLSIATNTRTSYGFVRAFIKDEVCVSPTEFFYYFQSEALDAVVLESWKRKYASTLSTSELVVRLTFGHYTILWCSPDDKTLQHYPSLLPPPQFPPMQEGEISAKLYSVLDSSAEIPMRRMDYVFAIGAHPEAEKGMHLPSKGLISVPERKRKERSNLLVKAEMITDNETACIDGTYLTLFRTDDRNDRYRLLDGAAASSITFHEDRQRNITRIEVMNQMHLKNAIESHATMKFLRMLFSGGLFKLTEIDTGQVLREFHFGKSESLINYHAYEKFLEFLVAINEYYCIDLRVPNPPCELPLPLAAWICHGKKHGKVEICPESPCAYRVSVNEAKKILSSLRIGEEIEFEYSNLAVELLGVRINLGHVRRNLINPRLAGSFADKENELASLADEDEVCLSILSDSVVDQFPQ